MCFSHCLTIGARQRAGACASNMRLARPKTPTQLCWKTSLGLAAQRTAYSDLRQLERKPRLQFQAPVICRFREAKTTRVRWLVRPAKQRGSDVANDWSRI